MKKRLFFVLSNLLLVKEYILRREPLEGNIGFERCKIEKGYGMEQGGVVEL